MLFFAYGIFFFLLFAKEKLNKLCVSNYFLLLSHSQTYTFTHKLHTCSKRVKVIRPINCRMMIKVDLSATPPDEIKKIKPCTKHGGTRTHNLVQRLFHYIATRKVKKNIEEDMWMRQTHTHTSRRQQQRSEEETDGRQPESLRSFILFPFFDNYMEI